MKILLLKQNINEDVLQKGIKLVEDYLATIKFPIEFHQRVTDTVFTSVPFVGASKDVATGYHIHPGQILAEEKRFGDFDVDCLIFDPSVIKPNAPTNPTDSGEVMQIPSNWFAEYPEVFALYFLHELAHERFWATGKPDVVHSFYTSPFANKPNGLIEWYLFLLKDMIPVEKPKPTPVPPGQRVLKKGMFGSDVQKLQEDLKYLGYLVINNTTQNFGSMTETAVVKLQRENGLTADGIVGQKTFAKIKELKEKPKIIQKKTPNFTVGRKTYKPEAIVIHVMDGTLIGTDSWFENPFSSVSSHYGIGKSGEIHQYVKEEDQAWHAGKVISPQWSLLKPGVNPNLYTIGIEHEGTASTAWPEAMKKASARLIKEISFRWSIPLDREHVIGHYQINGEKPNCPAVNKSVIDELINLAKVI